jgi:riboflavin kinase / FMN adenylyltransferase
LQAGSLPYAVAVYLLRSLDNLPDNLRRGAVAIGNFDGVHKGHARLVERLLAKAREVGGPAVVLTFDPHPVRLLRPSAAPPPLTWTDRKAELLNELGVAATIAYPTDEALLSLTAAEFFSKIVVERLAARGIVEGPNFYFGHGREGNIETLGSLCTASGTSLEVVEPVRVGDEFVSSSRVRQAIGAGDVDLARQMLTRPYRVRGMVTHGAGRGGKIGFPTANLEAIDTLLPGQGVYATSAFTPAGNWPAAVSIGPNPTFGEHVLKVEAHLIGFTGSLYGQPLELEFLSRLRGIRPFDSVESLKAQLTADVAATKTIADKAPTDDEDAVG